MTSKCVLLTSAFVVAMLFAVVPASATPLRIAKKNIRDVPTVPNLNVTAYLGTWYQTYTDAFNGIFERNPYCATAQYGLFPNGSVSVRNIDRVGAYNGTRAEVQGYAYQVAPQQYPGRLAVVFPFNPTPGPYWIAKLGEIVNGQYSYAIVTDNNKLSLFVLARDVTTYYARYNAEVQAFLGDMGYNTLINKPAQIPQGPRCSYF